MKLTIIIPCFNEALHIGRVLDKAASVTLDYKYEKEIIVVDDASTDNTPHIIEKYCLENNVSGMRFIRLAANKGKGAAIRAGILHAAGDIILIQDADLEYDPRDYNKLLQPIAEGYADVVYGSRFIGDGPHRVLFFFHSIGNKLLTFISNLFTQLNLTDMETGYKMFRAGVLKQVTLYENRFGFEPEVTAKVSRLKGIRIYEVGIGYYGRTFEEGKKISWKDGVWAVWCIIKYNVFTRK